MIVNGKIINYKEGMTIKKLLEKLDLNVDKAVVEVNLNIIPKENYSYILLNKEDKIEIISFVGGG